MSANFYPKSGWGKHYHLWRAAYKICSHLNQRDSNCFSDENPLFQSQKVQPITWTITRWFWGQGFSALNPTHRPLHYLRHLHRHLQAENSLKASCPWAQDLSFGQARLRMTVYVALCHPDLLGDVQCDTHSSPNRKVQDTALWNLRLHLWRGHLWRPWPRYHQYHDITVPPNLSRRNFG